MGLEWCGAEGDEKAVGGRQRRRCVRDRDYTGNAGMEEDDCCDEFEITVGAAQVQLTRIA